MVNILILFDLIVSHYKKPYFCLIRLGKAQGMTKRGLVLIRGKDPVFIVHSEVLVQVAEQGTGLSKTLAFLDAI